MFSQDIEEDVKYGHADIQASTAAQTPHDAGQCLPCQERGRRPTGRHESTAAREINFDRIRQPGSRRVARDSLTSGALIDMPTRVTENPSITANNGDRAWKPGNI